LTDSYRNGDIDRRVLALDVFLLAHTWGGTMLPNKSIPAFAREDGPVANFRLTKVEPPD
jgi:hypothetical protein